MRLSGVGTQRGFTLVEIMIAVAVLAMLAVVAVPSFFGTSAKAKAAAEVGSVFADIRMRLDQYFLDNAAYPPTQSEASTWPTTPTSTAQTVFPLPPDWQTMKIVLSDNTELYCGYAWITGRAALPADVIAGVANDTANIGPIGTALGVVPDQTAWYYLFAHCNIDGDSTVDSYYVADSLNTTIRAINPGR